MTQLQQRVLIVHHLAQILTADEEALHLRNVVAHVPPRALSPNLLSPLNLVGISERQHRLLYFIPISIRTRTFPFPFSFLFRSSLSIVAGTLRAEFLSLVNRSHARDE